MTRSRNCAPVQRAAEKYQRSRHRWSSSTASSRATTTTRGSIPGDPLEAIRGEDRPEPGGGPQGRAFTLIDPPLPPEEPVSPNRKLIFAAGLILSVGLAAGRPVVAGEVYTVCVPSGSRRTDRAAAPGAGPAHWYRVRTTRRRRRMRLAIGVPWPACVLPSRSRIFSTGRSMSCGSRSHAEWVSRVTMDRIQRALDLARTQRPQSGPTDRFAPGANRAVP